MEDTSTRQGNPANDKKTSVLGRIASVLGVGCAIVLVLFFLGLILFVIYALVSTSGSKNEGQEVLPAFLTNLFIANLFKNPIVYFSIVFSFMASICIHEFCHATVAHHLGDNTARNAGFQTLNPFKVMGWKSLVCLLLFGFSWGAVPVMPEDKNRFRRSAISLAGPLSNFALLLLSSLLLKIFQSSSMVSIGIGLHVWNLLIFLLYANAVLFLFNILPIPPLDGWNTFEPFLPNSLIPSPATKSKIFGIFIYLVCFSSASGVFDKGIDHLFNHFMPKPSADMALVIQGTECFEAGDLPGAYRAYAQAAEHGSIEGRLLLAQCLVEGWGCEPDPERAFAEFSKDEFSVYPLARFYHGLMLALGIGCEQDAARGYELLSQEDVQKNFPAARAIMGMLLCEGIGVAQDLRQAYALLDDEEVLNSTPIARHCLFAMLLEGEVCDKDAERAFSLLSDGDESELPPEMKFALGILYYSGEGCKQDFKKAAELLAAAADAGCDDTMEFLGYQDGQFVDYGLPIDELLEQMWAESETNNAADLAK